MNYLKIALLIFSITIFGCSNNIKKDSNTNSLNNKSSLRLTQDNSNDKKEIQDLIRKMLNWAELKKPIDLLPAVSDSKDSVYIGFDLEKLKENLNVLKASDLFSIQFVENYEKIISSLDKKLRNKEIGAWNKGELPPFGFANDSDPWCNCQDTPYDKPSPWDLVEVEVLKIDNEKGELIWKWGRTKLNSSADWKDFNYKFNVVKEGGKWKIAYLQGFDLKDSIK